jgi:hypothetical protein
MESDGYSEYRKEEFAAHSEDEPPAVDASRDFMHRRSVVYCTIYYHGDQRVQVACGLLCEWSTFVS